MKSKVFLILPLMILFSLAIVSSANTVTMLSPLESASVSGATYVLNASLDTNTLQMNKSTWFYDDGTTNTTIATDVANFSELLFNTTWASTGRVDIDSLTFWVNISNITLITYTADSSTGVKVDNGNPTATLSSATFTDNLALITGTSFTIGIDADATIGVSSCKVYYTSVLSSAVIESSATVSANACSNATTPTAVGLAINEAYTVIIEATDGNTNSTNATARTLRVTPGSVGGGSGGGSSATPQSITTGTTTDSTIQSIGFFQRIANFFRNLFSRK